jgi:hypothetical protein
MYSCADDPAEFYAFTRQKGGNLAYKASYYRQKGSGVGGVFGTIARTFMPIVRNLLPHILPAVGTAFKNVSSDIINERQPFKKSLKRNAMEALKTVGNSLLSQSGYGIKRKRSIIKRRSVKKPSRPRRKKVRFNTKPKKNTKKRKPVRKHKKATKRRLIQKTSIFDKNG